MKSAPTLYLGLDIGGTKTDAVVVDQALGLCAEKRGASRVSTPEDLVAGVIEIVRAALFDVGLEGTTLSAAGVGVPGQVDPESGEVHLAVNLGLYGFGLGQALATALNAPVFLENDARLAALGALHYLRQTESIDSLIYVSIGTGLAAGVVIDGRLHRGERGMAGEIGHAVFAPRGERCACGQRGCLETLVSGPAIVRRASRRSPQTAPAHAGDVYTLAERGDPAARDTIQAVSADLARALQWLLMTYDLTRVVLGGGVTRAGDAFLRPLMDALETLRRGSPLTETMLASMRLTLLPAGFNAGAWGAAHLARERIAPPT